MLYAAVIDNFSGVAHSKGRSDFVVTEATQVWQPAEVAKNRKSSGALGTFIFILMVTASAIAQTPPNSTQVPGAGTARVARLIVRVTEESGSPLDRQAVVRLYSAAHAAPLFATTRGAGQATFERVAPGRYTVEVSAVGYRTVQEETEILAAGATHEVSVSMAPESAESSAATPAGPPVLAPKARKETERGLAALKAGNINEARRRLEAVYKLAPGNPDINFLLGVLYLELREPGQAQTYLVRTTSLDPRHVPGLVALGQLRLRQGDYAAAALSLEQAASLDPKHWLAHWLLATACLRQREFEKARREAELAVRWGKGAANAAEFVLGEALAGLGLREEAARALEAFLRDAPGDPATARARELIAKLNSNSALSSEELSASVGDLSGETAPALGAPDAKLSLPSWAPPSVDGARPPVAEGAACALERVREGASKRVKEFVSNVDRFTATEELVHETLDELGKPLAAERRRFDYLVSIAEIRPGVLNVEEYRNGGLDLGQFPARIATLGLPALVLIFHPIIRDDFQMTCEGLGEWRGQSAWQVYFRQRQDRPSRIRDYRINGVSHPVNLKGRAWIAADTFQVLRLEADLVKPMPEIELLTEHEAIEYGPVQFQKHKMELWLPSSADLYFEFRRHRYHRLHSFRDYLLFSVDVKHEIEKPKETDENKSDQSLAVPPRGECAGSACRAVQ